MGAIRNLLAHLLDRMDDGYRPHRFPMPQPEGDVIAWKCEACGEWVREFGPRDETPCPVDWRRRAA